MALRQSLFAVAALLLLSCSEATVSQVVLIVDTDLEVPTELDQIRFDVVGPDGVGREALKDFVGTTDRPPALLTLVHEGGPLGPFEARVVGRVLSAQVVERVTRFSFVKGETVFLRVDLFSSCVGSPCPSNETCGFEGCRNPEATEGELQPWTGTVPSFEAPSGCASDMACADGVDCTVDACGAGTCSNVPNDTLCGLNERCDAVMGCVTEPVGCADHAECDDGAFCNGSEQCVEGTCQDGVPPDCDDSVGCTVDSCDEDADSCANVTDDAMCDDLVGCTVDQCDQVAGCTNTPDDSMCTMGDLCDATMGCSGRPCTVDADCDDGLACNGLEFCDVDVCRTQPAPDCSDGFPCTVDTCDDVAGCVNTPMDVLCDDSVACTVDVCDPMAGCTHTSDDTACDDGVDCTLDRCDGTACVFEPTVAACTLGELCDVTAGCTAAPSLTEIYNSVIPSCQPCHTNGPNFSGDLDMSSVMAAYANLVDVPAMCGTGEIRVIPFDSRTSLLWRKVSGVDLCGRRMPFAGTPLTAAQIAMIRDWIDAGAANN